jgi:hypothetical protein
MEKSKLKMIQSIDCIIFSKFSVNYPKYLHMKNILFILIFAHFTSFGQMTIQRAQDSLQKYHLGASTYFGDFTGHPSYGAHVILTLDGGAVGFGDGDEGTELIKLDKSGKVTWRKKIKKQFEETEPQCVAQDNLGNFYVFILNYNPNGYRGGCERVICYNKLGTFLWEKILGKYTLLNCPTVSYVRALKDGRIEMRGHVVREKPVEGQDPKYHYWQGWFNGKGLLTEKTGDIMDWSNPEWMNKYKPGN